MSIRQITAPDVKAMIDAGTPFEFVDVRTDLEREIASIAGSRLIDQGYLDELMARDRATPIVFVCHHGMRSQSAALHFEGEGFTNLYNLVGGIDAWSALVDPNVPRY